eukprot:PhM_4_TR17420/c3_g1_i1/m.78050
MCNARLVVRVVWNQESLSFLFLRHDEVVQLFGHVLPRAQHHRDVARREGLVLEQQRLDDLHLVLVIRKDLHRARLGRGHQLRDAGVDSRLHLGAVRLLHRHALAIVRAREGEVPNLRRAHAVAGDVVVGQTRRRVQVVRRRASGLLVLDLLSGEATEEVAKTVVQLRLRADVLVRGHALVDANPAPAELHDGHLADGLAVLEVPVHDDVARLVPGGAFPLGLGEHLGLPLEAQLHSLEALQKARHVDELLSLAGGDDGRLVAHVLDVGTGVAGRQRRELRGEVVPRAVCVGHEQQGLEVQLEDLDAVLVRRRVDNNLAIEAAGTEHGLVEHVDAVGAGHDDDARVAVEAVHFREQRVDSVVALGLLLRAHSSVLGEGIDLVDEDDARRVGLGRLEQLAHTRGTDTDVNLHEFTSRARNEVDLGLARDGTREHRLADAGNAGEEDALRHRRPEALEGVGVSEEVDHLLHLVLGLRHARNVSETGVGPLFLDLEVPIRRGTGRRACRRQRAREGRASLQHGEGGQDDQRQQEGHVREGNAVVIFYNARWRRAVQQRVQGGDVADVEAEVEGVLPMLLGYDHDGLLAVAVDVHNLDGVGAVAEVPEPRPL